MCCQPREEHAQAGELFAFQVTQRHPEPPKHLWQPRVAAAGDAAGDAPGSPAFACPSEGVDLGKLQRELRQRAWRVATCHGQCSCRPHLQDELAQPAARPADRQQLSRTPRAAHTGPQTARRRGKICSAVRRRGGWCRGGGGRGAPAESCPCCIL